MVIERHGKPIGFLVPIAAKDRRKGWAALGRLGEVVKDVLEETGLDEEALADEVTRGPRR